MIMPEYNTMCLYKAGMPFLKRPAITSLEETMTCCTMSIVPFMYVLALLLTYAPLPSLFLAHNGVSSSVPSCDGCVCMVVWWCMVSGVSCTHALYRNIAQ